MFGKVSSAIEANDFSIPSRSAASVASFLWCTTFLRDPIGKSPVELDPENAMEIQSDLFVLSSALEDFHQGMYVHLGSNVVHCLIGSKISHFHRVYKWRVRLMCVTCSGTLE